jgi:hypothetical protein
LSLYVQSASRDNEGEEKECEAVKSRLRKESCRGVLIAGALALMLVVGISLLLSHLQVSAKPVHESMAMDALAAPTVLTPTSQTRSPEKGALIIQDGLFTIQGVAWLGDNRPPFPGDPVLEPIENDGDPNYVVNWTESVAGQFYVLYEADNPYFEDQTQRYSGEESLAFISDQPEGTYYYRVKAYNAEGTSRWSNVESVTVGTGVSSMAAEPLALAAGEPITVWVQIDAGGWHTATLMEQDGYWEWSYDWTLPEDESYREYAIHTKASANGAFGPTDTITVTVNNRAFIHYFPIVFHRWPPIPYAPELAAISNPDQRVSYTLYWSYYDGSPEVPDPTSYTLEESIDAAFSDPTTYSTSAQQYTITDPGKEKEGGTYYYRVRGHNQYGPGVWSNARSTTVRVVPHAPVLQNIDNADGDDSYTVAWSYGHAYPPVDTFILQEATNASFSDAVNYSIAGSVTSRAFSDKPSETYYYRVKGRNGYGDGPWSVVKSVASVSNDFYDDFNDPDSGWKTHDSKCCLSGCDDGNKQEHPKYKYNLYYEQGRYHVKIPLDCRAGGVHGDTRHIYPVALAPDVNRPTTKTCMELKGTFEEYETYWSFWGLVFAASADKSTVWSLEVNDLGDWAVVKRTGYDFPGPNAPYVNENRWYEVNYAGRGRWPAEAAFDPNTLKVEIEGKNVKLHINGTKVHEFSDPEIRSLNKVGIIGGDWEITPTQIGFSYFYMDEGCNDY